MVNLQGIVLAGYCSARHRPSEVTAAPQLICVIATTSSNALQPHTPICLPPHPPPLPPSARLLASLNPHSLFPFIYSLSLLYPPPHPFYFCNPLAPIHNFILLLNLLFLFFLFLQCLIPLRLLITHPFS